MYISYEIINICLLYNSECEDKAGAAGSVSGGSNTEECGGFRPGGDDNVIRDAIESFRPIEAENPVFKERFCFEEHAKPTSGCPWRVQPKPTSTFGRIEKRWAAEFERES